ncbi:DUF4283 domain protein [Sesbania bispinosa]|nr:DUF4283 domain protein [Sesbania bispinosa]
MEGDSSGIRGQDDRVEQAPNFIIYDDEDVEEGLNFCTKSIIGRILTQKPIHLNSLHNALAGMWCNPNGFRIEERAPCTFQFSLIMKTMLIEFLKEVRGFLEIHGLYSTDGHETGR